MTRQHKTPAQRAQEQYDTAARAASRLAEQLAKAEAEFERLDRETDAAIRRRDFLSEHPDLPNQSTATSTGAHE